MAKDINEDKVKELDRLSMHSSAKMGRPQKWTPEVIDKLAVELVEFAEKDTSLILASFVLEKRMNPQIMSVLAALSSNFSEALSTSKRLIGARRETGTLLKKYEPKTYSMSQRMYDPEWSKHLDAQLDIDEFIKAKAKVKALENKLEHMGEIMEYIECQKKMKEEPKIKHAT